MVRDHNLQCDAGFCFEAARQPSIQTGKGGDRSGALVEVYAVICCCGLRSRRSVESTFLTHARLSNEYIRDTTLAMVQGCFGGGDGGGWIGLLSCRPPLTCASSETSDSSLALKGLAKKQRLSASCVQRGQFDSSRRPSRSCNTHPC